MMEISDVSNLEIKNLNTYDALMVAFITMKERCQQLQHRLDLVEEENVCLRLECGKNISTAIVKFSDNNNDGTLLQTLQRKVEELTKLKSQLSHHVSMVAGENRKLWNRLSKLAIINKTLGSQLRKISDTLKQHPPAQQSDILSFAISDINSAKQETNNKSLLTINNDTKGHSLEEISLRLINSIALEKSDLEEQYAEMVELQNADDINFQNIGFTYLQDSDMDSMEQLKQHDINLSQTKNALLAQQAKLNKALLNVRNLRKGVTCNSCRKNATKKMCQAGTQFDSADSFREHGTTQTSLPQSSLSLEKCSNTTEGTDIENRICPLCGVFYGKSVPFTEFHEHVLSHFAKESIHVLELLQ